MKKYELTGEAKSCEGRILRRIRALIDIPKHGVKAGDLGGWIETENNLSEAGNAWVYGDAWVFDNAKVCGNAQVFGNAWVCGAARVFCDAQVCGNAWVTSPLQIQGTRWFCNMAGKTQWRMGCCVYELKEWVERFDEITAENAQEDIKDEYWRYVKLACEMYAPELLEGIKE